MSDRSETEWATIGYIVAPFGIRGELRVYTMSDIPNRFAQLETIYLGPEHTPRRVLAARPHKGDIVVLRLQGVNDANMAETLRNVVLMIPAHQLAELPADIYYRHDILGLQVITLQGRVVGPIVDILETGGNDVYVIRGEDSGGKDVLIPAIKDVVKQVDLARRMMYIDPIAGLLNTDEAESDLPGEEGE